MIKINLRCLKTYIITTNEDFRFYICILNMKTIYNLILNILIWKNTKLHIYLIKVL